MFVRFLDADKSCPSPYRDIRVGITKSAKDVENHIERFILRIYISWSSIRQGEAHHKDGTDTVTILCTQVWTKGYTGHPDPHRSQSVGEVWPRSVAQWRHLLADSNQKQKVRGSGIYCKKRTRDISSKSFHLDNTHVAIVRFRRGKVLDPQEYNTTRECATKHRFNIVRVVILTCVRFPFQNRRLPAKPRRRRCPPLRPRPGETARSTRSAPCRQPARQFLRSMQPARTVSSRVVIPDFPLSEEEKMV